MFNQYDIKGTKQPKLLNWPVCIVLKHFLLQYVQLFSRKYSPYFSFAKSTYWSAYIITREERVWGIIIFLRLYTCQCFGSDKNYTFLPNKL